MKLRKTNYKNLLGNIGQAIETARQNAVKAVNTELVKSELGKWQTVSAKLSRSHFIALIGVSDVKTIMNRQK